MIENPESRRLRARRPAARIHPGAAAPYLGQCLSIRSDWTPLKDATDFSDLVRAGVRHAARPLAIQELSSLNGVGGYMVDRALLQDLAKEHGTPLFVVDHDVLRQNYARFKKCLPRVQAYYAVKANSDPAIVKTLYEAGCSFDVASMPEFDIVYQYIKALPEKERQDYIWDKIIYANPIKDQKTLQELDQYKPLVTYDNIDEIHKVRRYAPHAGLVLRIKVPNTGAMVELSSKFGASPGEAVDLIIEAHEAGLIVEGLSFHVGSQTTNFDNYVQALQLASEIFHEARLRGFEKLNLLDIGGGFPAPYDDNVRPFEDLARTLNSEFDRLFPKEIEILAEPGRFLVATAATAVMKIIGRPCAKANAATTSTTASTTPFRASSSTTASIRSARSRAGRSRSAPSSGRLATPWTRFRWPRNCPNSTSATCCIVRTSAPIVRRRRRGSTDFRRPRSCT